MRVVLDPPGTFALIVDDVPLVLQGGGDWEFDPQGKIGFMTENGLVSVTDLQVQTREINMLEEGDIRVECAKRIRSSFCTKIPDRRYALFGI
jgi:hypothetical protein